MLYILFIYEFPFNIRYLILMYMRVNVFIVDYLIDAF